MGDMAKLFTTGRSQAVRLPAKYRFEGKEVFVRKDEETGDVILSQRPDSWDSFFKARAAADVPPDFLDRQAGDGNEGDRDPFEGWSE